MARASASVPVRAMNRADSSTSVKTSAAAAAVPSPPKPASPTRPSSASTSTPAACASRTTSRVCSAFSSKGSSAPSNMTDVNPSRTARMQVSILRPWSRWTATGTFASRAARRNTGAISSIGASGNCTSASCRMIGECSSSAAATAPMTFSTLRQLKAPTA